MGSPRKRSQKLPLYHTNKRREDPLKILLAWVALLAVASTIWSLLHHHRRSAPEVDIHPSLIHYDARGGALLNINGTEPPEYARRDWQHLGTFRGAKGCLDAARGPGAAPCRSLRQGAESQLFLLARNGRLIVGGTVGEDPMRCVVAQAEVRQRIILGERRKPRGPAGHHGVSDHTKRPVPSRSGSRTRRAGSLAGCPWREQALAAPTARRAVARYWSRSAAE